MALFVAKFTKCHCAVGHQKGSLQRKWCGCSPWRAEWRRPSRPVTSEHLLPTAVRGSASWRRRKGTLCPRRRVTSTPGPQTQHPSSMELGIPAHVILHYIHVECLWALSWALQISIWDKWRRAQREPDWLRPVRKAKSGVSLPGTADDHGRCSGGNRSLLAKNSQCQSVTCHASFLIINGEATKEGAVRGKKLAGSLLEVMLQTLFSTMLANFISGLSTWGKSSKEDTSSSQTSASCTVVYQ